MKTLEELRTDLRAALADPLADPDRLNDLAGQTLLALAQSTGRRDPLRDRRFGEALWREAQSRSEGPRAALRVHAEMVLRLARPPPERRPGA